NLKLLKPGLQFHQLELGLSQGIVKRGLIAAAQGSEVDGLDGGIKLLLALKLAAFICGNDRLGGKNLHAEERGVGTIGRGEGEVAFVDCGLYGRTVDANGDEEF